MKMPEKWRPPPFNQDRAQHLQELFLRSLTNKQTQMFPWIIHSFPFDKVPTCSMVGRKCYREIIWWNPLVPKTYCDDCIPTLTKVYYYRTWLLTRGVLFLLGKDLGELLS